MKKVLICASYFALLFAVVIAVSAYLISGDASATVMHTLGIDTADTSAATEEAAPKTSKVSPDYVTDNPDVTEPPNTGAVTYGDGEYSYTADEITEYFRDVVFSSELDGYVGIVCKWTREIKYRIYGELTEEDERNLSELVSYLNSVDGFPGISEAADDNEANFHIHYTDHTSMPGLFEKYIDGSQGMVTFRWDTESHEIFTAVVAIVTEDVDQDGKNTVVYEEITQGLGLAQDSYKYPESLYYQPWTTPQGVPFIDRCMIELLYDKQIKAGMSEADAITQARAIIAEWGT
jgi:Protein of unknown function (DUF2927).